MLSEQCDVSVNIFDVIVDVVNCKNMRLSTIFKLISEMPNKQNIFIFLILDKDPSTLTACRIPNNSTSSDPTV